MHPVSMAPSCSLKLWRMLVSALMASTAILAPGSMPEEGFAGSLMEANSPPKRMVLRIPAVPMGWGRGYKKFGDNCFQKET